jgi:hypothetical protein
MQKRGFSTGGRTRDSSLSETPSPKSLLLPHTNNVRGLRPTRHILPNPTESQRSNLPLHNRTLSPNIPLGRSTTQTKPNPKSTTVLTRDPNSTTYSLPLPSNASSPNHPLGRSILHHRPTKTSTTPSTNPRITSLCSPSRRNCDSPKTEAIPNLISQTNPQLNDTPQPTETSTSLTPDDVNTISTLFNGKPMNIDITDSPSNHSNELSHLNTENLLDSHQKEFALKAYKLFHQKYTLQDSLHNNKTLFLFEPTKDAATHNANVLACYNFDLHEALLAQKNTQLFYGSEFKKSTDLEHLLQFHPLWKHTKTTLEMGGNFPLEEIDDNLRIQDNNFHLQRGNHKSATDNTKILSAMLAEDVSKAFALILPIEIIPYINKKISLAPLGCPEQSTINENGERISKHRLTHDQSFPGPSTLSVNKRVIQNFLPPTNAYGFALKRMIHYIVSLRQNNPSTKILISKFDFDAAYRRCHLSAKSSYECCTIHDKLLYMHLRLTFGGSPCPTIWNSIAEPITDICNKLIQNKHWDHNSISDPLMTLIKQTQCLHDDIPFTAAKTISVTIPINNIGKIDLYIDDNIAIALDMQDNIQRVTKTVIATIRAVSRPLDPNDQIPRKDIISLKKFTAEGTPSETKIVLGWLFNTRLLKISLPEHKYKAWNTDIDAIIASKRVKESTLEKLIGRLNHVACLMDMFRHFMGRLYQALHRSRHNGWTKLKLSEKEDLIIFQKFIHTSTFIGISMNNLTYRKPTHIFRSDSSLFGLGGYNIASGRAWRIELPEDCRLRTSLNSLEFLAAMISIWVDYLENEIDAESCLLSQTDSSSAAGWIKKSNFADCENEIVQLNTARKLASIIIDTNSCLYSQWFEGDANQIADALSRDFHLTDSELTCLILRSIPEQAPFGLKIYPVPPEIYSWLICLLRNQPSKAQWSQEPIRSKLWLGRDTSLTYSPLESPMMNILKTSSPSNDIVSLELSLTPSDRIDLIQEKLIQTNQNTARPPSSAWHRPTDWQADLTLLSTPTENLHFFYNDNSEVTPIPTDQLNNRQQ